MSLPRFDFAPHEWPPLAIGPREGLADAVFRVLWNWEEVEVAARGIWIDKMFFTFFRRLDFPSVTWRDFGWNARAHTVIAGRGRPLVFPTRQVSEEDLFLSIAEGRFGRGFNVDTRDFISRPSCWVFLRCDGVNGCWDADQSGWRETPFKLSKRGALLEQELENPLSDARFALDWSLLSYEEKKRYSTRLNGTWEELRSVVRAIALTEEDLAPDDLIGLHHERGFFYRDNARLQEWGSHILRVFEPSFHEELASRHGCVRQAESGGMLEMRITPPSQHERLEAALFLREWATGKIPSDELRLLLPKL